MDERLARYVRAQWTDLVGSAKQLCLGAGSAEAQDLVLSTLAKVAGRWPIVAGKDDPDRYVRRMLGRACRERDERREPSFQLMQVGIADGPLEAVDGAPVHEPVDRPADATPLYTADEALVVLARLVDRVRRRRLVAAGGAVVVVGAAVVTVAVSGGSAPHQAPPTNTSRVTEVAFPQLPTDYAGGVTAGGGYIWTIENHATRSGSQSFIVQRDPISGRVLGRYGVPEADDQIGYGLGKAWAWHDSDDFPTTAIATVDGSGDVDALTTRPSKAVEDATFTGDSAWFTEPTVNSVLRFPGSILRPARTSTIAGATFVVPLSESQVLVAGRTGTLHELPGGRPVRVGHRAPTLLSPAPQYGVWIGYGRQVSYWPSIGAAPTLTLRLPLTVGAVVGDPAHGVYVATRSDNPRHYDPYLVYYSPAALTAAHPQPTALLDGLVQAEHMVIDPAGGVVFTSNEGAVDLWYPRRAARARVNGRRASRPRWDNLVDAAGHAARRLRLVRSMAPHC